MQGQHRQLSASRRGLLKLLTSRTGVQILRQISETPCGSRLLYDRVVKGLTENSLNVSQHRLLTLVQSKTTANCMGIMCILLAEMTRHLCHTCQWSIS